MLKVLYALGVQKIHNGGNSRACKVFRTEARIQNPDPIRMPPGPFPVTVPDAPVEIQGFPLDAIPQGLAFGCETRSPGQTPLGFEVEKKGQIGQAITDSFSI